MVTSFQAVNFTISKVLQRFHIHLKDFPPSKGGKQKKMVKAEILYSQENNECNRKRETLQHGHGLCLQGYFCSTHRQFF